MYLLRLNSYVLYEKLLDPLLSGIMAEVYICDPELDFRSSKVVRKLRKPPAHSELEFIDVSSSLSRTVGLLSK